MRNNAEVERQAGSPIFTIIIVSLNAQDSIGRTIDSVLKQDFSDYQILVKDGGSTDHTIQNIPMDSRIKVYVQKDSGIYNAMNQALQHTSGHYILFLNCGDTLLSNNVLADVYEKGRSCSEETIIYGDFRCNGLLYKYPREYSDFYAYERILCHQSLFYHHKIFETHKPFNEDFRVAADYEHLIRCRNKYKVHFCHAGLAICEYQRGGFSEQRESKRRLKQEYKKVRMLYFTRKQRILFTWKRFVRFRGIRECVSGDRVPAWIRRAYRNMQNRAVR